MSFIKRRSMVIEERNFIQLSKLIKSSEKPVLLFLCTKNLIIGILLSPILKDLQFAYMDEIHFCEIKEGIPKKIKEQYAISRYPTFLFFKKGELVHKMEGFVNRQKIFRNVQEFLQEVPVEEKK